MWTNFFIKSTNPKEPALSQKFALKKPNLDLGKTNALHALVPCCGSDCGTDFGVKFAFSRLALGLKQVMAKSAMAFLLLIPCLGHSAGTDVQINTLIAQAIETHPLIAAARAEQQATSEGVNAAKLNMLPAPSLSSGYDSGNDLVSQLTVRQPLWTGGRLTANVNQAIFDDKAAVENIFEQQNEVAKSTIDAWQSYVNAVASQRVYSASLKRLNEYEEMMKRRVEQGVSARIELDLVMNRILQEQNAFQAATEQQRIAAARLQQMTGRTLAESNATTVPDLAILAQQIKSQSKRFESMVFDDASFYNPTVVKRRYQVESAKQDVKAKEAERFPSLYAQFQQTYRLEDNEKNSDGQISLGLNYEPGAGLSSIALAKASNARVQSLIHSEEADRRKVMENLQIQYQQFVSAKDKEISLVAAVAGAQIVLNSYNRQFIAGRKSWLDVLNAAKEQSQYEIQLVQARTEMLAAFYRLQVDFGIMGWQEFNFNRQPMNYFKALDPVRDWLKKHDDALKQTTLPQASEQVLKPDPTLIPKAEDQNP